MDKLTSEQILEAKEFFLDLLQKAKKTAAPLTNLEKWIKDL